MSTPHAPDADKHPTFKFGDKEYELKLNIFDIIELEKQGVNIFLGTVYDAPASDGKFPSLTERAYRIVAQAMHAENEKGVPISWMDIAAQLGFNGVKIALPLSADVIKKVRVQVAGPEAPAPTATVTPSIQ